MSARTLSDKVEVAQPHADVLIVGGGEAGLGVADELRALGFAGTITMAGEEPRLPYQRPPLSKGYLSGDSDDESLELRAPEYLREQGIDVWLGRRVASVDLTDQGGSAVFDDSTSVAFDRLVLATGAVARELPVPGAELAGVHSLRSVADAALIRDALRAGGPLVVIGGGFIGLEIAATARARGLSVTVVEAAGRLLERVCAEPLSDFCLRTHRAAGIDIRLDAAVVELVGTDVGAVSGVRLADGTLLPAEVVIVGVGAVPATGIAEKAGLECRRGIVVDPAGRTTHPRVVAAGDCTEQPHPHLEGELLAIESVNNAVEQSKAAAHTLLGLDPPARGVPWFWSDQGGMKIQIAGVSHGHDGYVVREEAERITVLYFRGGTLIAADVANNPRDFMAVKRAVAERRTVDRERAGDLTRSVKDLLREGA
ncbi:FAD-dependent pyridine nucleotide-disulfide oxidoreductase [Nocardioides sp. JS614]|nr:FAD-dependent pyridine nucleotide-disulfide oxidoreductase [Nocardioides sp. JS614]